MEYSKALGGHYQFTPIAFVQSPFKDKYGVPRQPSLAHGVQGIIKFQPDPDLITALRSLKDFTHLWVIFVFHQHGGKNWKPSVRPPRLGGRTKVGVLASRSPHRPNPIGMSVVKIENLDLEVQGGAEIRISGLDLLDGTPVLDIKPYIPYADAVPTASSGWAEEAIKTHIVTLSEQAQLFIHQMGDQRVGFQNTLQQVLEIDPRPAYQQRQNPVSSPESQGLRYGIEIMGFEVQYQIVQQGFHVHEIYKSPSFGERVVDER